MPSARLLAALGAVDRRGMLPTRAGTDGRYPTRALADVRWLVVHHTGEGTARPSVVQTAGYQTGPTAGWPFPSIAYTLYVEADGTVALCHDLEEECWSNGVGSPTTDQNQEGIYNQWTVSVCFSGQDPTVAQWASIERIAAALATVLIRALVLTGHGLLPGAGTDCPGSVARGRLLPPPI